MIHYIFCLVIFFTPYMGSTSLKDTFHRPKLESNRPLAIHAPAGGTKENPLYPPYFSSYDGSPTAAISAFHTHLQKFLFSKQFISKPSAWFLKLIDISINNIEQSYNDVGDLLEKAFHQWKGTPYRYGGKSRQGVDCSGLIQIFFREYLHIQLPRTTIKQIKKGERVAKNNLRTGDLVFFKTGVAQHHVGIIIKGSKFLNASSSRGVTESSLNNSYWRSRYVTARRILPSYWLYRYFKMP